MLDEDVPGHSVQELFGSMGKSMFSLFVMGTILDDVTYCTDAIRADGKTHMLCAFLIYILINSFTMMNMLVGILVEVVGNTADSEKKRVLEETVCENIKSIYEQMDKDKNGLISRAEFNEMRKHDKVKRSLADLDIAEREFRQFASLLFQRDEMGKTPAINFQKLLNVLLMLRPGTPMSALDFGAFRMTFMTSNQSAIKRLKRFEKMLGIEDAEDDELEFEYMPRDFGSNNKKEMDEPAAQQMKRINISMLARLERTPSADIISELQRRLGMANLEETGVPLWMMDEDLQNRVRSAESMQNSMDQGF
jgi:hypothetical protein